VGILGKKIYWPKDNGGLGVKQWVKYDFCPSNFSEFWI